ncbi:di/tricarboxylate transporter [Anaerospora hongkongensis]|uniref:Di/tricarboxylate transporter n=1 Tax=Anaerospora hongkongensis TaxID=244830 RepID=A0A4V2Q8X1_9FIRM|nr:SLC13 family permease [Anaerospora hongkongensis]TCL38859.1 di/tricarboxylate transporter [Anaerospora hongkongensis]
MSIALLIVLIMIAAIVLGYFTEINIGFYALAAAYVVGAFVMDLKVNDIIAMWPLRIFFIIFAVTLFYSFAILNGTLEKLAMNILYRCRKYPESLPFVVYFVSMLMSGMGAGMYPVLAFMCPLTMMLCEKTGMSRLLGAMAVCMGAIGGAYFITSVSGVIVRELIIKAGYAEQAASYGMTVFVITLFLSFAQLFGIYLFTRRKLEVSSETIEKPEPFTREQKINLYLIIAVMVAVLAPSIAGLIVGKTPFVKLLQSKIDIGMVAILASVVAFLFKIGDEKEVLKKVPWDLIILLCGVGILIDIAVKAGTLKILESWIGSNVPGYLLAVCLVVVSGIFSVFSSTLGVVLPTLYPMVPALASASGVSPVILFEAVLIGSLATGMAPFSTGGSLTLAGCPNDAARKELFPKLLFVLPPVQLLIVSILVWLFSIFYN